MVMRIESENERQIVIYDIFSKLFSPSFSLGFVGVFPMIILCLYKS